MSLRPKTLRRLGIIFGVVVVLIGIGVGLYLRNEHVRNKKLQALRSAGIASFEKGDYGAALESLKHYVGKVPSDCDALYAYGTSRFRYEESDEHIREAKNALLMVLQFDPNHAKTKRTLLELYTRAQFTTEAVELADQLLKQDPSDVAALRAKAIALDRQHKFSEALEVSLKVNSVEPGDLDQQLHTYDLMRKLGKQPEDLLARAQKEQQAHPDDPRFEMLLAMAYGYSGNAEKGKALLQQAAQRPAPDANFVRQMVRLLDSLKLYDQAEAVLERAAQNNEPKVLRILVQRLWQNHRSQDVVDRLGKLDCNHPDADTQLLAFKALSLYDLNRAGEAEPIVAALARRKDDAQAFAWSIALQTRFTSPPQNARYAVSQFQGAISRAPDNAVIRYMLGDAYVQLGETDLAIGAWRRAAELAPSWPMPRAQIAQALAASNRFTDAVQEAQAAVLCAPDLIFPAATLAAVRFGQLEQTPDPAGEKALFTFVEQVQKASPGEPQSLPAYVALLSRNQQRDHAIAALKSVIAKPKGYDQQTLLRLAGVSQKEKLGLENDLLSLAGREGETPRMVFARAADLASAGKADEGLALLEAKAKTATTQPIQWKIAICQYRESVKDPAAAAQWIELGDANANDLSVQTAILKMAASARGDRAFIGRTIDRLKDLTGPDALIWRIERARWLISSDNKEKDSADAVNTLNEVVRASPTLTEPHLLLSLAYENVGNLPAAAKELQTAADFQPNSPAIALDAARVLQLQSRFADARTYIERAGGMRDLTPELRRRCAIMLAQQGDLAAAIKTLESKSIMLETDGQLLLADLYRRANRVADAKLIYEKLIEAKPTELDVLRAAAAFYAQQQDKGRAEEILAKIDAAKLRPGGREILQAEYEERFGSPGAADAAYVSATHAAPDDEAAWAALVGYRIRQQHFVEAQQAADEGLSRIQKSAELAALKSAAVALGASADEVIDLRPLADTFAANPDHPAVKSLIAAVEDSRAKKLPTADALAAARKVIDQYPRFPALQLVLVQWTLKLGQIDEAIRIVSRTMEQFPGNPDAPRLATAVYRAAGKWDLMAASATRWRERTLDNPRHADIALAVARFQLNDPVGALKILQPYLTKNPDPIGDAELITAAARAHAAANHPTDAENLLEPLLDKDGSWRAVWLTIAASDLTTAPSAEAWLAKIAPRISDDAPADQYALANACYTASRRLNSKPLRDKCIAILDNLIKRPDATFAPFALHGLIAEQDGDFKLAEAAYRRSLSMNPNQPGPLNNLAYLILLRGGDLNEAKNLVGQAIALEPQTPEFYDTLARIQAKSDNAEAAVESFQKALRLDPNSLQALIGLASTYTAAGKKDAAAPLLNQIDVLLKARPNLSPALREELDAVRSTIKAVSIN